MSSNLETCIIAAVDDRMGVGRLGGIPWYYPEDLRRFRALTLNQCVVMGRVTFESLEQEGSKKGYLPQRHNVVLTSQPQFYWERFSCQHPEFDNIDFTNRSLSEVIESCSNHIITERRDREARPGHRICFVGGAAVYEEAISLVDSIYLTRIPGDYDCDRFFPPIPDQFELEEQDISYTPHKLVYQKYVRRITI